MYLKFELCLACLIALTALSGCSAVTEAKSQPAEEAPAIPVRTAPAQNRSMPVAIRTIGNVEAITTITIRPQVSGVLVKSYIRGGETVQEGDLLFEIDPRLYEQAVAVWEARLAEDKALLAEAEAKLEQAKARDLYASQQLARAETLAAENVWSRDRVEQVRAEAGAMRSTVTAEGAAINRARAVVRASDAALAKAKLDLSFCVIRSPISGRAGSLDVQPGNLVEAIAAELVTIRQMSPIFVTFSAPEDRLAAVQRQISGNGVELEASIPDDPGAPIRGKLTFLDNAVSADTGTIRLRGSFPNAENRLWPGQFVDVVAVLETRPNAVTVDASAIQSSQDGTFVYVVRPDKTVELRPVIVGPGADRVVSIEKGLEAGESVVVEGQLRIGPGMRVQEVS